MSRRGAFRGGGRNTFSCLCSRLLAFDFLRSCCSIPPYELRGEYLYLGKKEKAARFRCRSPSLRLAVSRSFSPHALELQILSAGPSPHDLSDTLSFTLSYRGLKLCSRAVSESWGGGEGDIKGDRRGGRGGLHVHVCQAGREKKRGNKAACTYMCSLVLPFSF